MRNLLRGPELIRHSDSRPKHEMRLGLSGPASRSLRKKLLPRITRADTGVLTESWPSKHLKELAVMRCGQPPRPD